MDGRVTTGLLSVLLAVACRAGSIESGSCPSAQIGRAVPYTVFLPADFPAKRSQGVRFPVVYLLHCAGCDDARWGSESYGDVDAGIDGLEVIAVAPYDGSGGSGSYGWWLDSPLLASSQWAAFVVRELKPRIDSLYPTYRDRLNTGLSGHSMGGFGSFHLLIDFDSVFAVAVPVKAAVDLRYPARATWPGVFGLDAALGTEAAHQANWLAVNVLANAHRLQGRAIHLRFYAGTQDYWFYQENVELHNLLDSLGVAHQYRELAEDHFPVTPSLMREILVYCDSVFAHGGAGVRRHAPPKTRKPASSPGRSPPQLRRFDLRGQSRGGAVLLQAGISVVVPTRLLEVVW